MFCTKNTTADRVTPLDKKERAVNECFASSPFLGRTPDSIQKAGCRACEAKERLTVAFRIVPPLRASNTSEHDRTVDVAKSGGIRLRCPFIPPDASVRHASAYCCVREIVRVVVGGRRLQQLTKSITR